MAASDGYGDKEEYDPLERDDKKIIMARIINGTIHTCDGYRDYNEEIDVKELKVAQR